MKEMVAFGKVVSFKSIQQIGIVLMASVMYGMLFGLIGSEGSQWMQFHELMEYVIVFGVMYNVIVGMFNIVCLFQDLIVAGARRKMAATVCYAISIISGTVIIGLAYVMEAINPEIETASINENFLLYFIVYFVEISILNLAGLAVMKWGKIVYFIVTIVNMIALMVTFTGTIILIEAVKINMLLLLAGALVMVFVSWAIFVKLTRKFAVQL